MREHTAELSLAKNQENAQDIASSLSARVTHHASHLSGGAVKFTITLLKVFVDGSPSRRLALAWGVENSVLTQVFDKLFLFP